MSDVLDLLRSLEWAGGSDADGWCPTCGGAGRHEPDCRLDRAIRDLASSAIEEVPVDKPCPHHGPIQRPLPPSNRVHCQACGATWDEVGRRVDGEPTVDEMAREMGLTRGVYRNWTTDSDADLVQLETDGQWVWRPSGTLRDHDLRSWPTDADAIRTLYREHKAKQRPPLTRFTCSRADCDDDQPHAHIESNLPIVDATKPPTDPAALAAWLYARVVPGRMVVERGGEYKAVVRSVARGRRCIILTGPDGEQVTAPGTLNLHLLNPDGTVLWEAP